MLLRYSSSPLSRHGLRSALLTYRCTRRHARARELFFAPHRTSRFFTLRRHTAVSKQNSSWAPKERTHLFPKVRLLAGVLSTARERERSAITRKSDAAAGGVLSPLVTPPFLFDRCRFPASSCFSSRSPTHNKWQDNSTAVPQSNDQSPRERARGENQPLTPKRTVKGCGEMPNYTAGYSWCVYSACPPLKTSLHTHPYPGGRQEL